jgi:putative NADPH-quinone reductase
MMTNPVLFVLAHPDLTSSRANKALAAAGAAVPGVTTLDLYTEYPDLFVDGFVEKRRIAPASAIVIQMPIFWYSGPGLLKEWMDRTFTAGWAYGTDDRQAAGKSLLLSMTTASDSGAWSPTGIHGAPVMDYMKPFQQFAAFCGMIWLEPLVFYAARTASKAALDAHAKTLAARLAELAGERTDGQ